MNIDYGKKGYKIALFAMVLAFLAFSTGINTTTNNFYNNSTCSNCSNFSDNTKVNKTGDTMSGDLDMNENNLSNAEFIGNYSKDIYISFIYDNLFKQISQVVGNTTIAQSNTYILLVSQLSKVYINNGIELQYNDDPKITVNSTGTYILEDLNMSDNNISNVNNIQINNLSITPNDNLTTIATENFSIDTLGSYWYGNITSFTISSGHLIQSASGELYKGITHDLNLNISYTDLNVSISINETGTTNYHEGYVYIGNANYTLPNTITSGTGLYFGTTQSNLWRVYRTNAGVGTLVGQGGIADRKDHYLTILYNTTILEYQFYLDGVLKQTYPSAKYSFDYMQLVGYSSTANKIFWDNMSILDSTSAPANSYVCTNQYGYLYRCTTP